MNTGCLGPGATTTTCGLCGIGTAALVAFDIDMVVIKNNEANATAATIAIENAVCFRLIPRNPDSDCISPLLCGAIADLALAKYSRGISSSVSTCSTVL